MTFQNARATSASQPLQTASNQTSEQHRGHHLEQPSARGNQGSTQDQGKIEGQVVQLSGNHMLSPAAESSARTQKISATLWIFTGKIASPGSPYWPISEAQQHPNFLLQAESNAEGHYSVALSPGEYTAFVQSGDALYLNAFQRDGSYQSVEVVSDRVTRLDLINTAEAAF